MEMVSKPTGRPVGRPRTKSIKGTIESKEQQVVNVEDLDVPPLNDDGLKFWHLVWQSAYWLNKEADFYIVKQAAELLSEYEELRRMVFIGQVPRFYQLPNGTLITHPIINQKNEAQKQLNGALASIGFTPADRARLEVQLNEEDDPLKALTERKVNRAEVRDKERNA